MAQSRGWGGSFQEKYRGCPHELQKTFNAQHSTPNIKEPQIRKSRVSRGEVEALNRTCTARMDTSFLRESLGFSRISPKRNTNVGNFMG
jgi:hypothetical protein